MKISFDSEDKRGSSKSNRKESSVRGRGVARVGSLSEEQERGSNTHGASEFDV